MLRGNNNPIFGGNISFDVIEFTLNDQAQCCKVHGMFE